MSEGTVPSDNFLPKVRYLRIIGLLLGDDRAMVHGLMVVCLLCCVAPVTAPQGEPTGAMLRRLHDSNVGSSPGGAERAATVATAGAVLLAAAAAACSFQRSENERVPPLGGMCDTSRPGTVDEVDLGTLRSDSERSASDWEVASGEKLASSDTDGESPTLVARRRREGNCGKLWSSHQFPEGVLGPANWDLENLRAAQRWACPCPDRANCIGEDRLSVIDLYEYRKKFRTTCAASGGLRDAARKELEEHYDVVHGRFARSFKVGPLLDCCAASAGLAKGLSFATWSSSRADCTHARPLHEGRKQVRALTESKERAHLEAYIRSLRENMEGPKGGYERHDKWHTGSLPISRRWEQYKKSRHQKKLPVIGSESLFTKLWRQHHEIQEHSAKGHAKCDK